MAKQFDNWQEYWDEFLLNRYGKEEVKTEDDLYFQVARTVNRKPVEKQVIDEIILQIIDNLSLTPDDILVDFCCGNGLFTYELKDKVKHITGVDFSQKIIDTANKYKSAPNITYCLGSAVDYMKTHKETMELRPNKYLMNESLAYFTPDDFEKMLANVIDASGDFKFLIRGVPNDLLKWNYYNTEERKIFYEGLLAKGDLTNDGLGRWWLPNEIGAICNRLNLKYSIYNQELPVSDYRMDVLISNY